MTFRSSAISPARTQISHLLKQSEHVEKIWRCIVLYSKNIIIRILNASGKRLNQPLNEKLNLKKLKMPQLPSGLL